MSASTFPRPRSTRPSARPSARTTTPTVATARQQFDNTVPGFKKLVSWLGKQGADASDSFVGMEHTGHYTLALCCFLQQSDIPYTLISPLELKKSMGLARGKSDRVDAKRIAQFTCLHRHLLKAFRLPLDCLLKLKKTGGVPLMAFRDRLVKTSTSLRNTIQDLRETSQMVDNKLIVSLSQKQQKLIDQQIIGCNYQSGPDVK